MADRKFKNVGIISTRIAGTDGVSLEISKWVSVLEANGFNCFYFAGELDHPQDRSLLIEEAHFDHPDVLRINESLFGRDTRPPEISDAVHSLKQHLKSRLYEFKRKFDLHIIVPENALTIPMNIPLGIAITEFIAETGIPAIAHHHDFYWERDRFLINACQDYLDRAFPPDLPFIRHVVINSLASRQLSHRAGISNTIIPNVYDFANPPEPSAKDRSALMNSIGLAPNDLFVLQPTRIVPRKWIERSLEIVSYLGSPSPALVVSHSSGDEGDDYFKRIVEYSERLGVRLLLIDHLVRNNNDQAGLYTIGDIYQFADLVTYPSGYEGFGNAFLESIYYKKPIIVNRYSIFITDIEPKGFDVIAIDSFATQKAITRVKEVLNNPALMQNMVETNYQLARRFFSYKILEKKLMPIIESFTG